MDIYFVTGNANKFSEAKAVMSDLQELSIDLPELQEIDPRAIIEAKLSEALKHAKGSMVVEDTSLYIEGMNGLPGPLIKWFLKSIGNDGIFQMAQAFGSGKAEAKTVIGYAAEAGHILYFEGVIAGKIVAPRGETKFGWDPIFQPDGYDKTFAEMSREEKGVISMRKTAFAQLKAHLERAS